jgi:SAM-dependent methyltransferase
MARLVLPPRGRLPVTGPVDAIEGYYRFPFGLVLRSRLRWVLDSLPARMNRVLEIGYGSGIFMYSLAGRAREIVGIDVHENGAAVTRQLTADGIPVSLCRGSGTELPFADGSFDAAIVVSALEFVPDPERCLREAARVTHAGGTVVCVTPCIHRWADRVYEAVVGFDPETEWQGGRVRVQSALARLDRAVRRENRPRFFPGMIAPYELVILEGRGGEVAVQP